MLMANRSLLALRARDVLLAAMRGTTTGPQAVVPNVKVYTAGKNGVAGGGAVSLLAAVFDYGRACIQRAVGLTKTTLPATHCRRATPTELTRDEDGVRTAVLSSPAAML